MCPRALGHGGHGLSLSRNDMPEDRRLFETRRDSQAWLDWAREIQALCQTGLAFAQTHYERIRYQRLLEIASEMVSRHTRLDSREVLNVFQVQPGYATVKVDVRGAVVQNDQILLVREKADGRWAMPGGWADVGEYPSRMIAREIREESGYEARPVRVVGGVRRQPCGSAHGILPRLQGHFSVPVDRGSVGFQRRNAGCWFLSLRRPAAAFRASHQPGTSSGSPAPYRGSLPPRGF